jgi:hypothetical protein
MIQKELVAALFVDADNLGPIAVTQAIEHLIQRFGSVVVRRAFGGHQKLADLKDVLRTHGIRAYVNQGKGTTDVALVVDVMDLLHQAVLPPVIALASSDADFTPLALRLREAGKLVLCFAQREKAAEADLAAAYGEVVFVTDVAPTASAKVVSVPLAKSPSSAFKPDAFADRTTVQQEPSVAVPTLIVPVAPSEADVLLVKRILGALPQWLPDTIRQLNQLGAPLRGSGIKKGNKPLHELFRKHPSYFKVLPTTGQPRQVKLLKKP